MEFRKWLAWKLQCLAARLYDGEWMESITVVAPEGEVRISVIGDDYGCGIASISGTGGAGAKYVTWPDPIRMKEWLES